MAAGGSSSRSSSEVQQAAPGGGTAGAVQPGAVLVEGTQQQQQTCAVVGQLLQLSKQRDAQLRCLVAKCISNFNPAAAQQDTTAHDAVGEVSRQLLQEVRNV